MATQTPDTEYEASVTESYIPLEARADGMLGVVITDDVAATLDTYIEIIFDTQDNRYLEITMFHDTLTDLFDAYRNGTVHAGDTVNTSNDTFGFDCTYTDGRYEFYAYDGTQTISLGEDALQQLFIIYQIIN
jgi:hypothetical protein